MSMGRGSGYSIREMEVYEYKQGDEKIRPVIPNLPEETKVNLGKGSYGIDDLNLYQPRIPKYVTENVTTPIPSNDWWTSVIYTRLSDTMPALPFVYRYSAILTILKALTVSVVYTFLHFNSFCTYF